MASPILADRFISNGASWIDLATATAVRLHVEHAPDRRSQLERSEVCAALARLRHPLLNPLLDYGAFDRGRVFEAYGLSPPVRTTVPGAQRLRAHAMQFLRAHGVELDALRASLAMRATTPGALLRARPLGIVLQERAALARVTEALDATGPGGPILIALVGRPSSGLRTMRLMVARAARLRGFVPLAPQVLDVAPWLVEALGGRHVCVLDDGKRSRAGIRSIATLLEALGRASARRHVVIELARTERVGPHVIPLLPMGVTAMASMVFVDAHGPSPEELLDAARASDGRPGLFLERLRAAPFEPYVSSAFVAHEATPPYEAGEPAPRPSGSSMSPPTRSGVLARAVARADAFAARGRHAVAVRLLKRATHVLAARGDAAEAARCAERLGRLYLTRGHIASALEAFERARASAGDGEAARAATLGLAQTWLEDARVLEAEALLRSMAVTDALDGRSDPNVAWMLARCLYWQGRYAEAATLLQPHIRESLDGRCLSMAARIELADGVAREAVRLARRACEALDSPPAPCGAAELSLASALAASGDLVAARQYAAAAFAAAMRAHRPLDALRARIVQLQIISQSDSPPVSVQRLADRLRAVSEHVALPRLLRFKIQKTLEQVIGSAVDASARAIEAQGVRWPAPTLLRSGAGLTELERMLEVCHTAPDDREALDRLCAAALERLRAAAFAIVGPDRRLVGHAGKPWDGRSEAVDRAVTSPAGTVPDGAAADATRLEAAEPVRFGGEVIGAVACRWIAGTTLCSERTAATLKAAALAAAGPLRAVLDRAMPAVADPAWPDLLGESPAAVALRDAVARAARAPYPVLLEGESGSGKELVARAVHRLSARRDRRFCAVNCAALTDELLEAELFGHTRGAFTGAVSERAGLFEEADGGTLFLDEVGELSARAQAKLLRVVQEGEIRRVGESFSRKIDVRIVAATNRRLEQEAAAGRFRADLRFRLDVIRIVVPPLRERPTDIPVLALHFWTEAARRVGSRATLSPDALAALARYDWPGNVRELQNVIAWMAVHSPRRGRLGGSALPVAVAGVVPTSAQTFEAAREEFERRFIRSALARNNGHRASAAESLGITRQGLAKMMRRLGMDERASP